MESAENTVETGGAPLPKCINIHHTKVQLGSRKISKMSVRYKAACPQKETRKESVREVKCGLTSEKTKQIARKKNFKGLNKNDPMIVRLPSLQSYEAHEYYQVLNQGQIDKGQLIQTTFCKV